MCNFKRYLELYQAVRSHIEFEYNQIGNRLNWLIASQAFLFVALVINLSSTVNLSTPTIIEIPIIPITSMKIAIPPIALWNDAFGAVGIIHKWSLFYPILPILGLLISIFFLIGSWAAILRITDLKVGEAHFRDILLGDGEYKYVIRSKNTFAHYTGLISIILIPISFIAIWHFIIDPSCFEWPKFILDNKNCVAIVGITINIFFCGIIMLLYVAYPCCPKCKIFFDYPKLKIFFSVAIVAIVVSIYFFYKTVFFIAFFLAFRCLTCLLGGTKFKKIHDQASRPHPKLMTTDVAAAKQFYGALFGWQTKDDPGGEGYAMVNVGGEAVDGMRSAWGVYVTVDDVDATAQQVEALGGKVLCPLKDIPNIGRCCFFRDPQGATLYAITYRKP